jgi:hypothetical protein
MLAAHSADESHAFMERSAAAVRRLRRFLDSPGHGGAERGTHPDNQIN